MTRRTEWWSDVFDRQSFLDLYRRSDLERASSQVDALQVLLEVRPPARVLDVCCGYGRHSVELARRGFEVAGVDISEMQVGAACRHARESGLAPAFAVGDARALPLAGPFDAAINMFLSFGYFATDDESQAMLEGVARVLRRGGRLLIDFWNREYEIRNFQPTVVDRRDDEIIEIEDWKFDPIAGRLSWLNTVVFPDGRREAWTQSIRAFTAAEVRAMLERAGFALLALYGSLQGDPYTMDSEAAVFVAEKI